MQEWEGYVIEVSDTSFTAKLIDITAHEDVASEEADFPIDEISDADIPLLKPGGVFRWSIGYQRTRGGTKKRVSQIVFRRLPQWTKYNLVEADTLTQNLISNINWE